MDTPILSALIALAGTVTTAAVALYIHHRTTRVPSGSPLGATAPSKNLRDSGIALRPVATERDSSGGPPAEGIVLHGFSHSHRKPRDLELSYSGGELSFRQAGVRVRVSRDELGRVLSSGGSTISAAGKAPLRFHFPDAPPAGCEVAEGEVVVDIGKSWICVDAQDLRAALAGFGVTLHR